MTGFIKDHRKELDSDIWLMPPLYHRTWQWLKYNVNHADNEIPMRDGTKMLIKRGQRLTSVRDIAKGISWYEGKKYKEPNPKTISAILDWMTKTDMILINRGQSNREYTLITLIKYEEYQEITSQGNSKVTVKKQLVDINNNDKELKPLVIYKKDIIYSADYESFYNAYPKKIEKLVGYKSWEKLIKAKEDPQLLIRCAMNYATYCKASETAQEFIKHPATFLNKQRYKDHINPVLLQGGANQETAHKLFRRKIGEISQDLNNVISRWVDHYGDELVKKAIDLAHATNKKDALEISQILKTWKNAGINEASNH